MGIETAMTVAAVATAAGAGAQGLAAYRAGQLAKEQGDLAAQLEMARGRRLEIARQEEAAAAISQIRAAAAAMGLAESSPSLQALIQFNRMAAGDDARAARLLGLGGAYQAHARAAAARMESTASMFSAFTGAVKSVALLRAEALRGGSAGSG